MKSNRLLLACALIALTSACAAERRTSSRPAPTPAPRPAPTSTAGVAPADWRSAPLTPGQWTYAGGPGRSAARYGAGAGGALLTLLCERAEGSVTMMRAGAASASVPLTVTTSDGTRAFSAAPQAGDLPSLTVRFVPRDSFLDQIAFSRGRFAVETPGLPTLYVPAWPEVGRVVEDCR